MSAVWPDKLRADLARLSDAELVELVSRAMRSLDLGLLAEVSNEIAERRESEAA